MPDKIFTAMQKEKDKPRPTDKTMDERRKKGKNLLPDWLHRKRRETEEALAEVERQENH